MDATYLKAYPGMLALERGAQNLLFMPLIPLFKASTPAIGKRI